MGREALPGKWDLNCILKLDWGWGVEDWQVSEKSDLSGGVVLEWGVDQNAELGTDCRGLACQAAAGRHSHRGPWSTSDLELDLHGSLLSQDKFVSTLWNRLNQRDQGREVCHRPWSWPSPRGDTQKPTGKGKEKPGFLATNHCIWE